MNKTEKYIFGLFLVLIAFLVFFRLGRHDMLQDDGHYAFRSLGYFDYMASLEQTTPVQWFGSRPWWSYLSFHDHPPLFFFIQHLFFQLFGASVVVSRLPSAFAALGSAAVLFFIARRIRGVRAGLFSLAALAVNAYFIWMGRIGLIEGVFTFFLLLGFLYFLKGLQEDQQHFLPAGLFFGLSMLTKYSFLFVIPAIFVYLIWHQRNVFASRRFWAGALLFFIVILPILVYNFKMYETRRHFDVQFADLFRQNHEDWTKLSHRVVTTQFNPLGPIRILIESFGWPYFVIFCLSFLVAILSAIRRKETILYLFILTIVFLCLFFSVIGSTERWLSILNPFAALLAGLALAFLDKKSRYVTALAFAVALFSLFYTLNTNIFTKPFVSDKLYASLRPENYGYNQLDKKISLLLKGKRASESAQYLVNQFWYSDIQPASISFRGLNSEPEEFRGVIVYDSSTLWFATIWSLERWKFYHRFFVASTEEFLIISNSDVGRAFIRQLAPLNVYLIESGPVVAEKTNIHFPKSQALVSVFKNQGIEPEIVYDDQGRVAFRIYQGVLN